MSSNNHSLAQEDMSGQELLSDGFTTAKTVLVPWLVVIKLMLGSFHVATPEYFVQQRAWEGARLGPLVPPYIGTCFAPPLGPDVGHCGQHCP